MKKFTWAHGVVVALLSFMCFILYLIFIFSSGQQNSDLVTENYYEDELGYQKVIDAKNNVETLEKKPFFAQLPYGVRLVFPEEAIQPNEKIHFELYHTSDQNKDKKGDMVLDNSRTLLLPKSLFALGSYTLKIRWNNAGKDYQIDYNLQWK